MRHFNVVLAAMLLMAMGCSNDKGSSRNVLDQPVSEMVKFLDKDKNGEKVSSNKVLLKKDLLEKDLIFGGSVTDYDVFPNDTVGGIVARFFSAQLVNLKYNKKDKKIHITRSKLPWSLDELSTFKRRIGSITVQSVTDEGDMVVDLSTLASGLKGTYGKMSLDGVASRAGFVRHHKEVVITEDHISFPVEVSLSEGGNEMAAKIRFYLKKWIPNENFKQTKVNKNFGFFTLYYMYEKYSNYPEIERNTPNDVVLKWELKNRTEPIMYVISKDTPAVYAKEIKAGIEAWNEPLKKMVGRTDDVILARLETENEKVVPGDPGTNYVYWEKNPLKGMLGMHASWQNDPITGEIFQGDVNAGGQALVEALSNSYQKYHGSDDSGKKTFDLNLGERGLNKICSLEAHSFQERGIHEIKLTKEEWVRTWIRQAMTHELGHNFGLRHNFKGSLSVDLVKGVKDSSVMDYHSNDVVLLGEGLEEPGTYDMQAMRFAHLGEIPAEEDRLPFCTDEQTSAYDAYFDPKCRRFDYGADPLSDSILPNLALKMQLMFEAKDTFMFNTYFNRMAGDLVAALEFLHETASDSEQAQLNQSLADLIRYHQKHTAHEKMPVVLRVVVSVYLANASNAETSRNVLQRPMVETLSGLVTDVDTEFQMSLNHKVEILDNLTHFRNSFSQIDQRMAVSTLSRIQHELEQTRNALLSAGNLEDLGGALTEDSFKLMTVNRLLELVEDRTKIFFGQVTER